MHPGREREDNVRGGAEQPGVSDFHCVRGGWNSAFVVRWRHAGVGAAKPPASAFAPIDGGRVRGLGAGFKALQRVHGVAVGV